MISHLLSDRVLLFIVGYYCINHLWHIIGLFRAIKKLTEDSARPRLRPKVTVVGLTDSNRVLD